MRKITIISILLGSLLMAWATTMGAEDNHAETDSESIASLACDQKFNNHGFEIKDLNEESRVSKAMAIEKAIEVVGLQTSQEAQSITAIRVKFSDKETPILPDSDIVLTDYPVWLVAFHGVNLQKTGPHHMAQNQDSEEVFADQTVVIDANTGEFLESFACSR